MPTKKSPKKRTTAASTPTEALPVEEKVQRPSTSWPMALVIFGLLLFIVAIALSQNKVSNQNTSENVNTSSIATSNLNANQNSNVTVNKTPELTNESLTNQAPPTTPTVVSEPRTLVSDAVSPAVWFPDGSRFVYTTDIEGESINDPFHKVQLNLYNVNDASSKALTSVTMMSWDIPYMITMFNDGSGFGVASWDEEVLIVTPAGETTIIKTPGKYKTSGDFSPDGKFFIYTTDKGGVMKLDVAAASITSLGAQTFPQPTATETIDAPSYIDPSYSPNGQWIVFERHFPQAERTIYRTDPEVAISLLSASAASIDSMTVIGKSFVIETEGFTRFDWSSDGRYVSHSWSGSVYDTQTKGVVLQANARFDDDAVRILASTFAPIGLRLLQTVEQRDQVQLQYLNLPSTTANVTPNGNTNWRSSPIWDPNGSVLYSYLDGVNPNLIQKVDLIDRSTTTLVQSGQKVSHLLVSPDGSTLLYAAQTKNDDDQNKNELRSITLP